MSGIEADAESPGLFGSCRGREPLLVPGRHGSCRRKVWCRVPHAVGADSCGLPHLRRVSADEDGTADAGLPQTCEDGVLRNSALAATSQPALDVEARRERRVLMSPAPERWRARDA